MIIKVEEWTFCTCNVFFTLQFFKLKCPLLVAIYSGEADGHVLFLDVQYSLVASLSFVPVGNNDCFVFCFCRQEGS
jgi:hypothetical protein